MKSPSRPDGHDQLSASSHFDRLFQLLHAMRSHAETVSAAVLAEELGVSRRRIHQGIADLQVLGAPVEGSAGKGYRLRPGYLLPAALFTSEEIAVLALGAQMVADDADAQTSATARTALKRIAATLPPERRAQLEQDQLTIGWESKSQFGTVDPAMVRKALRAERKLSLVYSDASETTSIRVVWPIAMTFLHSARLLLAWCELRQDFRHFRFERMISVILKDERYPKRRPALLSEWKERQKKPRYGC